MLQKKKKKTREVMPHDSCKAILINPGLWCLDAWNQHKNITRILWTVETIHRRVHRREITHRTLLSVCVLFVILHFFLMRFQSKLTQVHIMRVRDMLVCMVDSMSANLLKTHLETSLWSNNYCHRTSWYILQLQQRYRILCSAINRHSTTALR